MKWFSYFTESQSLTVLQGISFILFLKRKPFENTLFPPTWALLTLGTLLYLKRFSLLEYRFT